MTIPRRIFLTAPSFYTLSSVRTACTKSLTDFHRDFEIRCYSASQRRDFVKFFGNGFLDLYDYYSADVHKVELFSVLAVCSMGGFYFDTDLQFHRSIDPLLSYELVLTEEQMVDYEEETAEDTAEPTIGAYGFGAETESWFMDAALSEIASCAQAVEESGPYSSIATDARLSGIFTRTIKAHAGLMGLRHCILRGSALSRWNEFGIFATHLIENER